MPQQDPRTLTPYQVTAFLTDGPPIWCPYADTKTLDNTQRKGFDFAASAKGTLYKVARRYIQDDQWQTIYQGTDLVEAVRLYNSLS